MDTSKKVAHQKAKANKGKHNPAHIKIALKHNPAHIILYTSYTYIYRREVDISVDPDKWKHIEWHTGGSNLSWYITKGMKT